jgi:DNA-binding NtrC family response regulator
MSYKPNIIVVDDESRMRESLKILLRDKDYRIGTFSNGHEALNFLEENECDLVLLDLMMPVMDGYQVMTRLKERYPDLAVIIMTGHSSIESAIRAQIGRAHV